MGQLIAWWVRNPVAANLLMFGILIFGALGLKNIEKEAFPSIELRKVQVEVIWLGASAQEIEQQIIQRIEDAIENVDNVYRVYSEARESVGRVTIETYPKAEPNDFANDVERRVNEIASFPRGIENPRIYRVESGREILSIAVVGDIGERELSRLSYDLRQELSAQPYISRVELFGVRQEEVAIELTEAAMHRYGLSFGDIASAIRKHSMNVSFGQVHTATGDIQLHTLSMADTASEFERIIVRQSVEGATIRVGDVARVIDGFEEKDLLTALNGTPAVLLQIQPTENMQITKSSESARQWIEETNKILPEGVHLELWSDVADVYNARMGLIVEASWLGLMLVFVTLLLTLQPKVAIWVSLGIGTAFLGAFVFLPANDVSLNLISTFALLLVLGIVVDDAIVVGESIHNYADTGVRGEKAAIMGALNVARPVIFAVLTTIVAFAPWLFMSSVDAQLVRQLSIVISLALVFSLIEAFFILPAHLRDIKPRKNLKGISLWQQNVAHSIVDFSHTYYGPFLRFCMRKRYITAMVFFAGFIVSIGLVNSGWVKFYFLPQIEGEEIVLNVDLPVGTPYERAQRVFDQLQQAEKRLVDEFEQDNTQAGGSGGKKLVASWFSRVRSDNVLVIIRLVPPEVRDLSTREVTKRLRELVGEVPGAEKVTIDDSFNHSSPMITFLLQSNNDEELKAASEELQQHLRGYASTFFVRDDQQGMLSELRFNLKPGAQRLGLTLADISTQLHQAYYGEEAQRLPRESGDVRVMIRYPYDTRSDLTSLDDFIVRTPDGRSVPLQAVADISYNESPQRITRRDGRRIVQVTADVNVDSLNDVYRQVNKKFIPNLEAKYSGLEVLKGGSQESEVEFFDEVYPLYIMALFMIYVLIAVAFKSYSLPVLVMIAIPYGFMGAVFGHLLFDLPMALLSYFGISAAAGVVVNDNLVLIDCILRREKEGVSTPEAVVDGAIHRFRPILLTTVTTFIGLAPIMIEQSTSTEFLKPAVLSLSFGVLFALFVSLLMVPALYLIGWDWRRFIASRKNSAGELCTEDNFVIRRGKSAEKE